MNIRGVLLCVLLALVLAAPAAAAPQADSGLPLGPLDLKERRTTEQISPGITYTRIERGQRSKEDFYTVDVAFKPDRGAAESVAGQLWSDGYEPNVVEVSDRAPDDPRSGPLGYLVRTGAFATEAEANALRDRLAADGYTGLRVVYTGEDGGATTGPWVVHVLEVDPSLYGGTLAPELATEIVPGRELLTSISRRTDALAATNGGYFVIGESDGTPGDLAGISVIDGTLVSEAVDSRTSLILPSASGGVASAAVQAAKLAGARVIASVGSPEKVEVVRGLGADDVFCYRETPVGDAVRAATRNGGVDAVVDTTGGPLFGDHLAALRPDGRLVTCGAHAGDVVSLDVAELFRNGHRILDRK